MRGEWKLELWRTFTVNKYHSVDIIPNFFFMLIDENINEYWKMVNKVMQKKKSDKKNDVGNYLIQICQIQEKKTVNIKLIFMQIVMFMLLLVKKL